MFIVVSVNDHTGKRRILSWGHETVLDAGKARAMSGDLVFDDSTGEIVRNKVWLFPWERRMIDCYAQRKIRGEY